MNENCKDAGNSAENYPRTVEVSPEEQIAQLKEQLEWKRVEARNRSFDLAIKTGDKDANGLFVGHTAESLVTAAETIYQALIKDFK